MIESKKAPLPNVKEIKDHIKVLKHLQANEDFQQVTEYSESLAASTAKYLEVSTHFFYKVLTEFKANKAESKSNPFQFQNKNTEQHTNRFDDEIFLNFPYLLRDPCEQLVDRVEKEVFLVTGLGIISGILPNVLGHYGGRQYEANLFIYLIGSYGEGKGALTYARRLVEGIHQEKVEHSIELNKDYKVQIAQYKKSLKLFEQGKIQELPPEPPAPPHLKLIIPANIGKSGIIQLLHENAGRAIICEGEADTLSEAFKQEHGGFSDVLRQAYGHEAVSLFRRTGNEDIEITHPCLSVILTSTLDQLTKLIPTVENGLFSRFLYYCLEENPKFNNVFDKNKTAYTSYFNKLGVEFKAIYDYLNKLNNPIYFELQPQQESRFVQLFQEQKDELRDMVSSSLGGTVNRLGLICFRIAMQLSVVRAFETGEISYKIICTDQDFENALRIIENLKKHAVSIYYKLPKPKAADSAESPDKDLEKSIQKRKCREYHQQRLSYREISVRVFGSEKHVSKVYRFVNEN